MKKYELFVYIVCLCILLPLLLYSLIVIAPNNQWHGFGVDSNGYVYIGKKDKIVQYHDNNQIGCIPIPSYRTYSFTLQHNDTILIADSSKVNIFDLSGNHLYSYQDPGPSKYSELQWLRKINTVSGDTYRLRSILGFHTITKNGDVIVYHTSMNDYALSLLAILSFVIILGTTAVMLVRTNFRNKNENL